MILNDPIKCILSDKYSFGPDKYILLVTCPSDKWGRILNVDVWNVY